MNKKVIVLSLGGSLIIPSSGFDVNFLKKFKQVILKNCKRYKFIIVCGGGSTARIYASALKSVGVNILLQNFIGISSTRMNARFMSYFFSADQKEGVPHTLITLEKDIKKQNVVFCGALEYKPNQTSDSTAADIAKHFNTIFINLTNVSGLYDKNPLEYKNAKFISEISWKNFDILAKKIKFEPGQHFVLDQTASKNILKNKIPTYILGPDLKQLDNLLNNKKFIGTSIKNF